MPIEHQGQKLYTPKEAANMLGLSVGMLRYLRNEGRIQGTELGTITLYTKEQIDAADTTPKQRGPHKKGGMDEANGRATPVTPHVEQRLSSTRWVA